MTRSHGPRGGIAAVWALVVVAMVTALAAAAAARLVAARKQTDSYRNRAQAEWLARAGHELAVARLLATPDGYTGETATPTPGGEVTVVVRPDPARKGVYRVECEAKLTVNGTATAARLDRTVERTTGPDGPRIAPARPGP